MKKRIGTNGIIIFAAVATVFLFPRVFLRLSDSLFDDAQEAVGMVLMLSGMLLRISSRGFKSEQSSGGSTLVTGGPYRLVRNPMYVGIVLTGGGIVLLLFHWWASSLFLAFMLVRYLTLVRQEEKILRARFCDAFTRYCREVPQFVPRLGMLFRHPGSEVLPLRLRWIVRELPSLIWLLVGILGVEYWEALSLEERRLLPREFSVHALILVCFVAVAFVLAHGYEKIPSRKPAAG